MQSAPAHTHVEQKPSFAQWRLLVLLIISVFINYIDRSNLSVSATNIKAELGLSAGQLGDLHFAFFLSYGFCLIAAGWLIDRFDVHWVFGIGFL